MGRNQLRFINVCLLALALGVSGPANANPDVWVEAAITFHFSDQRVTALSYEWRFDNYFSSRNIGSYDKNRNGQFEADEIAALRLESFAPLERFGYYAYFWQGETSYRELEAVEFSASIDDDRLVFNFQLRVNPAADPREAPLAAGLFDAATVVDFRFREKRFLLVDGALPPGCKFKVARGKGARADHPQIVTLTCES